MRPILVTLGVLVEADSDCERAVADDDGAEEPSVWLVEEKAVDTGILEDISKQMS